MVCHIDSNNGRESSNTLKDFYEAVGANAKAIVNAEKDIHDLFYLGEKRPHMWWDEFEARLTNAFAIVDKDTQRQVYTDDSKLWLLNQKIKADFLTNTKTTVQMEMIKVPSTMTYATALANYRNVVNEKFPYDPTSTKSKRRLQNLKSNKSGDKRKGNDDGNSNQSRNNNRSGSNPRDNNPNDGNSMRSRRNEWKVIGIDGK